MIGKPVAFLSHSSSDKPAAQDLAADLRACGIGIWIDSERIRYGHSISRAIESGLAGSTAVLVLVSKAFLASRWCRAEYEPVLSAEIDTERVLVIPVLLEQCELPLMLRAKRYCDLTVEDGDFRAHERRRRNIQELADQIMSQHGEDGSVMSGRRGSFGGSSTATLPGSHDLPSVESLADEVRATMTADAAIDLLAEVARLVEQFESQYDELATVLTESAYESSIYGSAYRVSRNRLLQANRKLITISNEMRSIARHIERHFSLGAGTKGAIESVTATCLQIAVAEDFLVIHGVANSDGVEFNVDRQRQMTDGSHFTAGAAGSGLVERYHEVLIRLNDYKISLREAILELELRNP